MFKDHPTAALAIALLGAAGALGLRLMEGAVKQLFRRKQRLEDDDLARVKRRQHDQAAKLEQLKEEQLRQEGRIEGQSAVVNRHMQEEEQKVWPLMQTLATDVAGLQADVKHILRVVNEGPRG